MTDIQKRLFALKDEKYKDFQSALIPDIDKDLFIGVRTPELKKFAKGLSKTPEGKEFLSSLPHKYFDENQLHAFIISEEKDFEKCVEQVESFLPYIDNWATCDQLSPKCFYKNSEKLLPYIERWLKSENTFTVRFAVVALMRYFLDDDFKPEYAERIAKIKSDEYYINIAIAWYFATALAKQWEDIFPFIAEQKLGAWIHNKAIQKALESFRITEEQKTILRGFKIKKRR